ncbi:fimbria/pilus periplasmic chaperone [Acidovorax sp. SUPP3334]|uniref:fimbrial biogenesis chaperone n=1 Tax=Acidovorax sp. SUPP3334 TaxID=2920881 RepID=UPI0023DE69DF|nr:fimbria/pilus periplasmic chaperone [Acidovorax sp. SUPP3334]GKT23183.1 fimbria/pilus periplasmic chaperone [Acidovorax sp. SUPP3334]
MVTMPPFLRRLAAALAWAMVTATAIPAWAATPIMIWPVDPVITGPQRAVALWLENRGSTPVSMQVRVFQWRQADGKDQFDVQRDVVASPPISHIPPGQRQMVRLLATQPVPPRSEQTYRVLVDELPAADPLAPDGPASIPGPPERANADAAAVAVRLQIRYAIPLFVYGPDTLPRRLADARSLVDGTAVLEPDLSWDLKPQGRASQVVLHNRGTGHARITSVVWTRSGASAAPPKDVLNYVLPQSQMPLDVAAPPSPGHTLAVTVNGREAQLPRASQ